jgi:hypothetical protein
MSNENNEVAKPKQGFQRGVSGNPAGHPKSTKTKSERLFDKLMNSKGTNLERILDRVMTMAEAGDGWAAKAIMDRVFPARGRTIKLNLGGNPGEAVERVIAAMDVGELAPVEAKDVLDVLRARAEMVEAADVARRLEALERE